MAAGEEACSANSIASGVDQSVSIASLDLSFQQLRPQCLLCCLCWQVDEETGAVQTLAMGRIASFYYMRHQTMATFAQALGPGMDVQVWVTGMGGEAGRGCSAGCSAAVWVNDELPVLCRCFLIVSLVPLLYRAM